MMNIGVEQFNKKYPIGTTVVYQSIRYGEGVSTKTRSEAWELGDGHPVVMVDGQSGGVSIEHVTVVR
ncbi:MAG: hypothetical protein HQ513_05505 [Rhodospirillales bacterium]|nr:hypothetical protein [Rhodospirillales bacterium]